MERMSTVKYMFLFILISISAFVEAQEESSEDILPSQDGYYLDTLNDVSAGAG